MNPALQDILAELRNALTAHYGSRLRKLRLYGSHARGEATPESDIDVLVLLRGRVNPGEEISQTADLVAALSLRHDVVISCAFVSESRYRRERSPFLVNVRRESVAV
jgi:predicted nucleotidyltransferase